MKPIAPMLAHVAPGPFDSEDHLFEIKWDGIRVLAFVEADRARLQSRQQTDLTEAFPEIVRALAPMPPGTVLDGELVVLVQGRPDRQKVLRRMSVRDRLRIGHGAEHCPATYVAFDLLACAGSSWMARPLLARRARFLELIDALDTERVIASPALAGQGSELFGLVQGQGLEGVMAKRLDGRYLPGRRSRLWLKILNHNVTRFELHQRTEGPPV